MKGTWSYVTDAGTAVYSPYEQVPEINAHTMADAKLIANPNCTTAIAAVVLHPIIKEFGIRKLIMSTYQAASGAGAEVSGERVCEQTSFRSQTYFQQRFRILLN
jgi:aspartate-semialdehyde dehydrogenase